MKTITRIGSLSALTLALFAVSSSAQKVSLPPVVTVKAGRMAQIIVEWEGDDLKYTSPGDTNDVDVFREYDPDPKKVRLRVVGYTLGKYKLNAIAVKSGKLSEFSHTTITVESPNPVPPTPTPVPPGPNPPGPTPIPDPNNPSPIAADGFRVLIVEEVDERAKLPQEQLLILFDERVRSYLKEKCVKDAGNPDGAFRIWDKDTDPTGDDKTWQGALKRTRTQVPWILISNHPKGGYEGPLPKNVDETLSLLKKYGG